MQPACSYRDDHVHKLTPAISSREMQLMSRRTAAP